MLNKFNSQYHCTFALNPKEAHTPAIREAVMAALPGYLDHPLCPALGEVGYDVIDDIEEQVILEQLEMAKVRKLPVLAIRPYICLLTRLTSSTSFEYQTSHGNPLE